MTIPITPTSPACYGVCCVKHQHCARYYASEGLNLVPPIGTCLDKGKYPMFVKTVA